MAGRRPLDFSTDPGHLREEADERQERHSDRYSTLPSPIRVTDYDSLRMGDPGLFEAFSTVKTAIEQDMIPQDVQKRLLQAMTPAVRRALVAEVAGLEQSVLTTFNEQIHLIESILRRVVNPNGSGNADGEELGLSTKDAINMALKLNTAMVRDLPKIYTLDRVQRLETALFNIVEKHLDKDTQNKVLEELERLDIEAAKRD